MARVCLDHAIPQPAICELCARHVSTRRRTIRVLVIFAMLVGAVGAGVAYLETRPPKPPPPPEEKDVVVKQQRERLAKRPCDHRLLTEHVQYLMETKRWEEARLAAHKAVGCGVTGRMKWHIAYINQQLRDWVGVVVQTTELLNDNPQDSDFWWWRGEAFVDAKLPALAVADYRQSLANSFRAQGAQFAAQRFLSAARPANAMCEAARAWRYYVRNFDGEPTQDMRDETAALVRDKTCAAEKGTGGAILPYEVKVTIEGTTGTFIVDERYGTTVLSRMFATKVGLQGTTTELVTTSAVDRVLQGEALRVSRIEANRVSAANVEAMIVDELPDRIDGVLGLSFLWHWDFQLLADDKVRVAAPIDDSL